jgi:hypothetical protein
LQERSVRKLRGADDDVVDGDEDQLHEEANETHHDESDGRTERHLGKLYRTHQL